MVRVAIYCLATQTGQSNTPDAQQDTKSKTHIFPFGENNAIWLVISIVAWHFDGLTVQTYNCLHTAPWKIQRQEHPVLDAGLVSNRAAVKHRQKLLSNATRVHTQNIRALSHLPNRATRNGREDRSCFDYSQNMCTLCILILNQMCQQNRKKKQKARSMQGHR